MRYLYDIPEGTTDGYVELGGTFIIPDTVDGEPVTDINRVIVQVKFKAVDTNSRLYVDAFTLLAPRLDTTPPTAPVKPPSSIPLPPPPGMRDGHES